MKYEITDEQMKELSIILSRLNRLEVVFSHANGAGFLRETTTRLYGLLQRIEMQDIEDVLEITPDGELAFQLKLDI